MFSSVSVVGTFYIPLEKCETKMHLCNRTAFVDMDIKLLRDGSKQIADTSENEIKQRLIF